jgi:hypothetical protein
MRNGLTYCAGIRRTSRAIKCVPEQASIPIRHRGIYSAGSQCNNLRLLNGRDCARPSAAAPAVGPSQSAGLRSKPFQKLVFILGQLIEELLATLLAAELMAIPPAPNEPELGRATVRAAPLSFHHRLRETDSCGCRKFKSEGVSRTARDSGHKAPTQLNALVLLIGILFDLSPCGNLTYG